MLESDVRHQRSSRRSSGSTGGNPYHLPIAIFRQAKRIAIPARSTRRANLRIIAATNRDTLQMVRDGRMREDFYYRIHVLPVHLPPLRDRRLDIPLLVEHFPASYGDKGLKHLPLPAAVMDRLMGYDWPGNVRELQNVLHRYVTLGHLVMEGRHGSPPPGTGQGTPSADRPETVNLLADALAQFEKDYIREQLQSQRWHVSRTAAILGSTDGPASAK